MSDGGFLISPDFRDHLQETLRIGMRETIQHGGWPNIVKIAGRGLPRKKRREMQRRASKANAHASR